MRPHPSIRGGFACAVRVARGSGSSSAPAGSCCFLESELGLPPLGRAPPGARRSSSASRSERRNLVVSVARPRPLPGRCGRTSASARSLNALLIGVVPDRARPRSTRRHALCRTQGLRVRGSCCSRSRCRFFGAGSAFYIAPAMGAGPRDSLMLVHRAAARARGSAPRGPRSSSRRSPSASRWAARPGSARSSSRSGSGRRSRLSFWLLERTPLAAAGSSIAAA